MTANVKGGPTNCILYIAVSVQTKTSCRALTAPIIEDPDDNPFLQSFYENSQKYAFATQIHFVMQRSQQINTYFSERSLKD